MGNCYHECDIHDIEHNKCESCNCECLTCINCSMQLDMKLGTGNRGGAARAIKNMERFKG